MNGELLPVWSRTWQEVWAPLARSSRAPDDLFVELVRDLAPKPQRPLAPPPPPLDAFNVHGELVDVAALQERDSYEEASNRYYDYRDRYETALNAEDDGRAFFRHLLGQLATESDVVSFIESAYRTLAAYGGVDLTERFRAQVKKFIVDYNIRYELREPFSLHATIPGVFSKMISEIRRLAAEDDHLKELFAEFEEAFSDLKSNRNPVRIKTCLQKQFNLLEALGRTFPNVTETTLGAMCNQLDFPHAAIREVGKKLYGFGSNYPGVRHAGHPHSAIRQLQVKDLLSVSLMLASFTPYLINGLDSDRCYTG